MRDILVLLIVFAGAGAALRWPWIGVLTWTWVSIMNPHRQAWGVAYDFPVALLVALATMVGLLFEKQRRNPFVDPSVMLLAFFMGWVSITYPFSFFPEKSTDLLLRTLKIDFFIILSLILLQTKKQIHLFCWVVVLSLGVIGAKGGLFTIATGGSYRVWGPGGFIGENNAFALALTMAIPLMRFLQLQQTVRWKRWALLAMMFLCSASVLGSQSRGGLLAIVAMSVFLWFKTRHKWGFGIAMVIVGIGLLSFMPEDWVTRMHSIGTYEQDQSAMGRINAWWMAWNLALDRLAGGGFDIYYPEVFARYAPDPQDVHAAHSIYFQVLGEHGFVGLALFLGIWLFVWKAARSLIRDTPDIVAYRWCRDLGAMCQVSLIGYLVGGAFLSLSYFDLPYDILALVVMTKRWLADQQESSSVPTQAQGAPDTPSPTIGHRRSNAQTV